MAAEELKLGYEHINVDLLKGEQRTPEHRARHPFGMVPVIEHDGRFLFESNAIMKYLARMSENSLYPRDNWEQAQVDQWTDYSTQHMGRYLTTVFVQKYIVQLFGGTTNESKVKEFSDLATAQLPAVEAQLKKNPYLAGDQFTLADIAMFSLTAFHSKIGVDFSQAPSFERWTKEVQARASVQTLLNTFELPFYR